MEEDEVKGPVTPASWAMQRKSEQRVTTQKKEIVHFQFPVELKLDTKFYLRCYSVYNDTNLADISIRSLCHPHFLAPPLHEIK